MSSVSLAAHLEQLRRMDELEAMHLLDGGPSSVTVL